MDEPDPAEPAPDDAGSPQDAPAFRYLVVPLRSSSAADA
jgi:hypothetical protein